MQNQPKFLKRVGRRIGEYFLKDELNNLSGMQHLVKELYQWGPEVIPPEHALAQMQEYVYDSQLINVLTDQLLNWENITADAGGSGEEVRIRLVQKARGLYVTDAIVKRIIDLWTDFGFGVNCFRTKKLLQRTFLPKDTTFTDFT